jgi:hypothetical protein
MVQIPNFEIPNFKIQDRLWKRVNLHLEANSQVYEISNCLLIGVDEYGITVAESKDKKTFIHWSRVRCIDYMD